MMKILLLASSFVLLLGSTFTDTVSSLYSTSASTDMDKILVKNTVEENCEAIAAPPCSANFWGQIDGLSENEVGLLTIRNYNTGQVHTYYLSYGSFSIDVILTKGKTYGMKLCNKIPNINFPGNNTNAWISACSGNTWVVGDCHEHFFIP